MQEISKWGKRHVENSSLDEASSKVKFNRTIDGLAHLVFNPQRFPQTKYIFFPFFSYIHVLVYSRVNFPRDCQMITSLCEGGKCYEEGQGWKGTDEF